MSFIKLEKGTGSGAQPKTGVSIACRSVSTSLACIIKFGIGVVTQMQWGAKQKLELELGSLHSKDFGWLRCSAVDQQGYVLRQLVATTYRTLVIYQLSDQVAHPASPVLYRIEGDSIYIELPLWLRKVLEDKEAREDLR